MGKIVNPDAVLRSWLVSHPPKPNWGTDWGVYFYLDSTRRIRTILWFYSYCSPFLGVYPYGGGPIIL